MLYKRDTQEMLEFQGRAFVDNLCKRGKLVPFKKIKGGKLDVNYAKKQNNVR